MSSIHPLYVDAGDEVTTVIERLKAAPQVDLALIVPKNALLLQSIVNLKLVKRAAADAGKELTVVTTDKIGRNLAAQVGLANLARLGDEVEAPASETVGGVKVHNYYDESETNVVPLPAAVTPIVPLPDPEPLLEPSAAPIAVPVAEPETIEIIRPVGYVTPLAEAQQLQGRSAWPFIVFLVLLLLVGVGTVSAYYLPKTDVAITVPGQAWNKTYATSAVIGHTVDATHPVVPSYVTATKQETVQFKATGQKNIGTVAMGTATLSYIQDSNPQTVPAGTVLTANNLQFTTNSAVTVPGAKVVNAVPVAGSASVPITAVVAGTASNLSGVPATVAGSKLYGQITNTSGGTSQVVPVVSDSDLANAHEQLLAQLKTDLGEAIKQNGLQAPGNNTNETDQFSVVGYSETPTSGTQASAGSVTATGTLKRLVYDPAALTMALTQDAQGDVPNGDSLSITNVQTTVQDVDAASGSISFTSIVSGELIPPVNLTLIRKQIPGQSLANGTSLIQGIAPGATVKVVQTPSWWPLKRFPSSEKYLTVHVTQ
jgi:hypothetical protein